MRRLVVLLALLVAGLAIAPSPQPTFAVVAWPALLNCYDVTDGADSVDGAVTMLDVFKIAGRFGAAYPSDDYLLLYDVSGGGAITIEDILAVAGQFGRQCPLMETQVAKATLATEKYRDWSVAQADGYAKDTQYVTQMGIHVSKADWLTVGFNPETPFGLIYTDGGGGQPDELIGLWYVAPIPDVCAHFTTDPTSGLFGINPATCPTAEPVGFGLTNTDEDNQDLNVIQKSWHDHNGLCTGDAGLPSAWVRELGAGNEDYCLNDTPGPGPGGANGDVYYSTYGWMVHLYNFIRNPSGRFVMWNSNLP